MSEENKKFPEVNPNSRQQHQQQQRKGPPIDDRISGRGGKKCWDERHFWGQRIKGMARKVPFFRRRMNPQIDPVHRVDNCLSIWVLEAKGVPAKRQFVCELSLDGQMMARTSTKVMEKQNKLKIRGIKMKLIKLLDVKPSFDALPRG
ncbi:hypothetical protein niasHT_010114 [Heterodera trifolii]|uniref:Uncharacterized protein n=1 Tax=Heterodera trifolii TaxID=157864 RepID=A0ABD2LWA0_9BILA